MTAGLFLCQVVLDSQGSLVGPDPLVGSWDQIFPDLWETLASLDWMESMVNAFPQSNFPPVSFPFLSSPFLLLTLSSLLQVSKVLPVLPGRLVQAQPRETEVTPVSRASLAPQAGKEKQASPEAPDSPAAPVSKVK